MRYCAGIAVVLQGGRRIPMVQFSPGEGRFVLAVDECVEIAAYMAAIETLVLSFEEILGIAA